MQHCLPLLKGFRTLDTTDETFLYVHACQCLNLAEALALLHTFASPGPRPLACRCDMLLHALNALSVVRVRRAVAGQCGHQRAHVVDHAGA